MVQYQLNLMQKIQHTFQRKRSKIFSITAAFSFCIHLSALIRFHSKNAYFLMCFRIRNRAFSKRCFLKKAQPLKQIPNACFFIRVFGRFIVDDR